MPVGCREAERKQTIRHTVDPGAQEMLSQYTYVTEFMKHLLKRAEISLHVTVATLTGIPAQENI